MEAVQILDVLKIKSKSCKILTIHSSLAINIFMTETMTTGLHTVVDFFQGRETCHMRGI